jgi:Bacterial SH3 domain.
MIRALPLAVLLLAACNGDAPEPADNTDTRMPITVEYVRGATLKIHAKPSDAAPVVTTYQKGESVSVLARRGEWAEVRTATGSGWAHAAEMADAAEAQKAEEDNLKPHFTRTPEPVTQPGAHGELVLEADVNADGIVTNVRTLSNTTGSASLEQRNTVSLRGAVFTPVVRHGRHEAFVYEHRVHY